MAEKRTLKEKIKKAKEPERDWQKGYPKYPGIYLCRVNHETEAFFVNHYCEMNRRCRWQTLGGKDVIASYIEWTGEAVGLEEVDVERGRWPR